MIKKQADQFFQWFCRPEYYDDIRGDLEELYQQKIKKASKLSSDLYYSKEILLLLRISLIKPFQITHMFRSLFLIRFYLKTTWRNALKYKAYSLINIFGLALGLAACFLVFSYTHFESGYDQMHPNKEQLFRVNQTAVWNPEGGIMSSTAPPLAALLKDNYPEIEASTRVNTPGSQIVRYEKNNQDIIVHNESNILAADSNFFDFFAFPLKEGDPKTALVGVGKVVISDEMAEKYFGKEPALGKILEFGDQQFPVQVSGVTYPQAENIHFNFDFLWSMPTNPNVKRFDWSFIWTQMATYVKVAPHTDIKALESKFKPIADNQVQASFTRLGMNYEDFVAGKGAWNFYLQPVKDIHLKSVGVGNRIGPIGDISIISLLQYVALLILLIALLNFINLATARASTRAKEIGVKKTIGALRGSIISQFLIESIAITTVSTLLALSLVHILRKVILQFSGIQIPIDLLYDISFIPLLIIIPIGIGLIAGLYPAFYLSAFQATKVLKGNLTSGLKSGRLRNILVTIQFTIAIALMSGTILIYQQLNYVNSKNLGFNEENILVVNHADKLGEQINSFKEEAQKVPEISNISIAMDMPGRGAWEDIFEREGSDIKLPISQNKIDEDFFPTMDLQIVEGRSFNRSRPGDIHGLVINETTKKLFNWEDGIAIGKEIIYPGYPHKLEVIGVVKDFHFQSLRVNINPMMFFHVDSDMWGDQRVLSIKYQQKQEKAVLAKLEGIWNQISPELPFDYSYFDNELTQLYEKERSLSSLISIFTGFSLFIAFIGLIGLLAFSAEQRKKELGIRKVLGASGIQLFSLLSKQYLQLFLLALFLAIPLAWPTMQNWLDAFAYRININLFVFIFAGISIIILLLISLSYLSITTGKINLANVLKNE